MNFCCRYLFIALILFHSVVASAVSKNGFDLSDSLIPANKILSGGPPRDGIPSIDNPKFVNSKSAEYLREKDRVIGIYRNGIAKAYPIRILNWHEVVNDRFADEAIVISFCPLCNTGMVFTAQGKDVHFTFGVSGLLYNSDILLYDRQTGSLWSQVMGKAISGPLKGALLPLLVSSHTSWGEWKSRYSESLVLSKDTGFKINYRTSPYLDYTRTGQLYFPVENRNKSYQNKELVLGVKIGKVYKAYPFKELKKQKLPKFTDVLAGKEVSLEWNKSEKFARILDKQGIEIPSVIAYWFAWYAFYPETEIYRSEEN